MKMNFKEFFDETQQNALIVICLYSDNNEVWNGLYKDIPKKTWDDFFVTSYDVTEFTDNTLEISVIIE